MLLDNSSQFHGKRVDWRNPIGSWSVCPHLSHPDKLFGYYVASGMIMLILGKCLCHECYESILKERDIREFMESCDYMVESRFQKDLIDPLFEVNGEMIRAKGNVLSNKTTRSNWISCLHVSKAEQLGKLYISCNPIFFHEGFVTCNDCIKVVPSASSYAQTLMGCEAMMDQQLQNRVIDRLYSINRDVLESARHNRRRGYPYGVTMGPGLKNDKSELASG